MDTNRHNKLALIVSASIASVKSFDFIQLLLSKKYEVHLFLTKGALQWVTKTAAEIVTGRKVFILNNEVNVNKELISKLAHFEAIIVFASTANFISVISRQQSKISRLITGSQKPLIFIPAMNVMMWRHPAIQRNVKKLINVGVNFVGPAFGNMACGDKGYGRLLDNKNVIEDIFSILNGHKIKKYHHTLIKNPQLPRDLVDVKNKASKKLLLIVDTAKDALIAYPLISELRSRKWTVICVIEEKLKKILPVEGLATISNNKVYTCHYQEDFQGMEHIRLSEMTDLVLMVSVTKNRVEEMVNGNAESFIGCIYLATKKPVVILPTTVRQVVPSKASLQLLKLDGVRVLPQLSSRFRIDKDYAILVADQLYKLIEFN